MTAAGTPTPERIFQIANAFQSSQALKGALDLHLFTALGGESATAASLARQIGASEKGTRVLCDFLVIAGLLQKEGDHYRSAPDAALFLDEHSPAYFGSVGQFMLNADIVHAYSDIAAVVRKGGTLLEGQGTVEPNNPIWVDFARNMVPLMMPSATFIAELVTMVPRAAILVTGVEDPDTRAHGANDGLHLAEFERVCLAEALLLGKLGDVSATAGRLSDLSL